MSQKIPAEDFDRVFDKALYIQEELGLHLDKDVFELAQLIYEKELENENRK